MAFMQLRAEHGTWYVVENHRGDSELIPGDLVPGLDPEGAHHFDAPARLFDPYLPPGFTDHEPLSFDRKVGWCARYSAPGYMDCTEWVGPYATREQAETECREMRGDDEDEQGDTEDDSAAG
jgi:hypothetical protein